MPRIHICGIHGSGVERILGMIPEGIRKYSSDGFARLAYIRLQKKMDEGSGGPIWKSDVLMETANIIHNLIKDVPDNELVVVVGGYFASPGWTKVYLTIDRYNMFFTWRGVKEAIRKKRQRLASEDEVKKQRELEFMEWDWYLCPGMKFSEYESMYQRGVTLMSRTDALYLSVNDAVEMIKGIDAFLRE